MSYKVFISYSWSNSAERRSLRSEIARIDSATVLVDKDIIEAGDPIHQRVLEMIDAADCVVVLLTPEGLQSREVLDEISRSHDRHKFIIPIVAEGTKLEDLPWYLRDLSLIQYNPRNFDAVVDIIVNAIKKRANPFASIDLAEIPAQLKELIDSGTMFINVPLHPFVKEISKENPADNLYCELLMRQTDAAFVVCVPRIMEIGAAAEYLVARILPHLRLEDYEWSLVHRDMPLPSDFTFAATRIRSGDTIYLLGNHTRPEWAPCSE